MRRHYMRRHMARDMRSQKKMRTFAKGLMLQTFAANLRGFVLLIEVLVSVGDGLNGYECIALFGIWNSRISLSSIISRDETWISGTQRMPSSEALSQSY